MGPMNSILRSASVATTLLILALSPAAPAGGAATGQFSSTVRQVEVYVTVADQEGRPVKDLTREAFTVLEDDRPQEVTTFAASDFPASIALAVDRSLSMDGAPLTMAKTAGRVFLSSLRHDDRAALIAIGSQVDMLAPLAADRSAAEAALTTLDAWGVTLLNDAVVECLDLLSGEPGRRAVVLLSDGEDRFSRATDADVVARARGSDVMVYPVTLARRRSPLFAEIGALSGGRSFQIRHPKELEPILTTIAEELRWQYLLGFAPARPWPADRAEWRGITVIVNRPGLKVRARSGYMTK